MADNNSGWDNTNDSYSRGELASHQAEPYPIAREDDGFVGLDTIKPDAPDDSMHFIHQQPGEVYTRPIPSRIEKTRSAGSEFWIARTYVTNLINLANTGNSFRVAGKRRGRRSVEIRLLTGTYLIVSSDRFQQPLTIGQGGDYSFVTPALPISLPTENEVWVTLPLDIGVGNAVFSITEFYDE